MAHPGGIMRKSGEVSIIPRRKLGLGTPTGGVRGYADFRESPKSEVRRIPIPRTSVNKGIKGAGAAKSPGPGGGCSGCSGVTRPQPSAARTSLGCLTTGDPRLDALVYEGL